MNLLQVIKNNKVTFLSGLGAGLEYYDFVVYMMLAPYISKALFPQYTATTGIIGALSIFSAGYFIRPLGGIVFGALGDRYGRKITFLTSITLMALATMIIAFIPDFQAIGLWAPVLLLLCRTVQGFSLGAELPGAITFISEHANDQHRGLHCGFLISMVGFGALLSSLMAYLLTVYLSEQSLLQWGWRIPFLLGGLLGIISYYLRKRTVETPVFAQQKNREEKSPFFVLLAHYHKQIVIGFAIMFSAACFIIFALYAPTYVHTYFGYSLKTAYLANTASLLWSALLLPFTGFLSDQLGRKKLLIITAAMMIFFAYPLFYLLSLKSDALLFLFFICYQTLVAAFAACYPAMLAELFPTQVRYSGVAFCYNVAYSIASFSPIAAIGLIEATHQPLIVSLAFLLLAISTLLGGVVYHDKTSKPLPQNP